MTRGGKRTGSGRKVSPDKKKAVCIKLRPATIARLAGLKNKNAFIEAAIEKALEE